MNVVYRIPSRVAHGFGQRLRCEAVSLDICRTPLDTGATCGRRIDNRVILQIAGSSEIYTNDNLTDEVAAAFLKEHPNAAGRFEVIPTAEKDAEAPKAGGESSELEAAHNRIAILESEKVELESRCAALQARIDAAAATETAATDDEKPGSDDTGAESADEADERPAGNNGNTADDAIRQAIAAELVAGKSKTAIKQELAGKEIGGVKLTHRLISDYIEKITAEE